MKTVNLLLCFLDACMSDEMMNKGTYMAMADEAKCTAEVEGESSESGDSAQETKYARMLTKMVVENSTTPMTSKGHAEILKESPQPDQRIYHSTTMHAGKSDEYPNGLFQLDYTVFVLVKEMNGVVLPTPVEIKYMRGQLKSDVGGVTWRETASDFQGGTLTEAIEFSGDANETKGSIQYEENHQVRTMTFGSKGAAFCRKQDGAETCFTRQLSEANIFYREYGLYNDDGTRFDLAQPPINIKVGNAFGRASVGDVWLPLSISKTDGMSIASDTDPPVQYTLKMGKGKLYKNTKTRLTLNEAKGVPFELNCMPTVTIQGTTYPSCSTWNAYWDGTEFVLTAVKYNGAGGTLSGVTKSAAAFYNMSSWSKDHHAGRTIYGFSQAAQAYLEIDADALLEADPGNVAASVTYVVSALVSPGDVSVPTSLACVIDCATFASLNSFDPTDHNAYPYTANSYQKHGEIDVTAVEVYNWTGTDYMLTDSTGNAVNSDALDTSKAWEVSAWSHGIRSSNSFVAAADLPSLKCTYDTTKYCHSNIRSLSTTYSFETGLRTWNAANFLKDSDGKVVEFSEAKRVKYEVPNDSVEFGIYAGANVYLTYSGFKHLQGIPQDCYDETTNELVVDCSGGEMTHLPAFQIPAGSKVTVDGETKWVRALEHEIRFKKLNGTGLSASMDFGSIANLPSGFPLYVSDLDDPSDPSNLAVYPGPYNESAFDIPPSVIDGELTEYANV